MGENDILGEKIQSILSNPESLKSIMQIASGLGLKASEKPSDTDKEETKVISEPDAVMTSLPEQQKPALVNSKGVLTDDRMNLLLSIKPFLNEKKRQRIDSVIKAMQAAKLINAYKDSDLFSNFGIK